MKERKKFSYVLSILFTLVKQGQVSDKEIGWLRSEFENWFYDLYKVLPFLA